VWVVLTLYRGLAVAITVALVPLPSAPVAAAEVNGAMEKLISPSQFLTAGGVMTTNPRETSPVGVGIWCPPLPTDQAANSALCSLRATDIIEPAEGTTNVIPWALSVQTHANSEDAGKSLHLPNERAANPQFPDLMSNVFVFNRRTGSTAVFDDSSWATGGRYTLSLVHGDYRVTGTCRTKNRKARAFNRARRCATKLVDSQIKQLESASPSIISAAARLNAALLTERETRAFESPTDSPQSSDAICRIVESPGYTDSFTDTECRALFRGAGRGVELTEIKITVASTASRARGVQDSTLYYGATRSSPRDDPDSVVYTTDSQVERSKVVGQVVVSVVCRPNTGQPLNARNRDQVQECARQAVEAQFEKYERVSAEN